MMQWRATILAALLLASGCSDDGADDGPVIISAKPEPPSAWHHVNDSAVVALDEAEVDDELQAAMAVARASADEERENWLYSSVEEKKRWAIKWAAPTADDRIEFIWVRPVAWSPHRIEGVLANVPANELKSGKTKGDYVSFPIEEMADWVRFRTDDFSGSYEGGYTLEVLTGRHGTP